MLHGTTTGNDNVLVTGATGYVGGRLVPRLLSAGYRVRVLVRDPRRLQGRTWLAQVDVAQGDVLDPAALPAALAGVQTAYYLIHSLQGGAGFHQRDLDAACAFGQAAAAAGVQRLPILRASMNSVSLRRSRNRPLALLRATNHRHGEI